MSNPVKRGGGVLELLNNAANKGVSLFLDGEKLRLKLKEQDNLDKDFLDLLKFRKDEIIEFLTKKNGQVAITASNLPIIPFNRKEIQQIPLSFSQERLWLTDKIQGSLPFHQPVAMRIKGNLEVGILEKSLKRIIDRHEIFRTVYLEREGVAFQEIIPANQWNLNLVNRQGCDEKETKECIRQEVKRPFDLSKDYMLRCHLYQIDDAHFVLLLITHHIAVDGWSFPILIKELFSCYHALNGDRTPNLPELPIQYSDYAIWIRENMTHDVIEKKLRYWKTKLSGAEKLHLATDYPNRLRNSNNGKVTYGCINREITKEVYKLSKEQGVTLFMTLLTAFKVLLNKYSGQSDISIGTPIANRIRKETECLIGFFINTLVIRSDQSKAAHFIDFLSQVRTTTLQAYDHQDVSYEKVINAIGDQRSTDHTNLGHDIVFMMNNVKTNSIDNVDIGEVHFENYPLGELKVAYDIHFNVTENEGQLEVLLTYNGDLFSEAKMTALLTHYNNLLREINKNPYAPLSELDILGEEEKKYLLKTFNDTKRTYPSSLSIIEVFQQKVAAFPDKIAVVHHDQVLTYHDLDRWSDKLASLLHTDYDVRKGDIVGVILERSKWTIISLLGILKAGGAYMPIDPDYPLERIGFILQDARPKVLITNSDFFLDLAYSDGKIFCADIQLDILPDEKIKKIDKAITNHDLAYVIYTSGSTGNPKGVLIEHGSNVNMSLDQINRFGITEEDNVLQFASLSFDASIYEIFMALCSGASLIIADNSVIESKERFISYIKEKSVSIATLPPTYLNALTISDLSFIRVMITAGEAPIIENALQCANFCDYYNAYGPTECAVCVSTHKVGPSLPQGRPIPIGKPVSNLHCYILDEQQQLVPIGVPGELCVAGVGVGRGYLNRPELTRENFISNPFADYQAERLYQTGDIAKWSYDGNLIYLGRKDEQVKIRGHRIELEEIEITIPKSNIVEQCVVLAEDEERGSKRLVAYIVPSADFNEDSLRTYLKNRLPGYMVPGIFIQVPSFPLTTSGKIDKKALALHKSEIQSTREYTPPQNEVQEHLAELWKDLLKLERVGIHDNFFELGGDSIISIQVVSRARKLGFYFQPKDLFECQTISELSLVVTLERGSLVAEQGKLSGYCELSPIQKWFLQRQDSDRSHYNQSLLMSISKRVDEITLQKAVQAIIWHHDALRFVYEMYNGVWKQYFGEQLGGIEVVDLTGERKQSIHEKITETCEKYQKSLNPLEGQVLKVVFIKTSLQYNRILFVAHHLVIDGVSWRILTDDFEDVLGDLLKGKEIDLGIKTSSFRDWVAALSRYANNNRAVRQINIYDPIVNNPQTLPVDYISHEKSTYKSVKKIKSYLDKKMTRILLKEANQGYHTEINDILLSALVSVLNSWSGNDQLVVNLEGHGREEIDTAVDVSRTVGWFTNFYPIAFSYTPNMDSGDLIKSVKEQLRVVPDKGMGYLTLRHLNSSESLRERLSKSVGDVNFNYLGQADNIINKSEWFKPAKESVGNTIGEEIVFKSKLEVNCIVINQRLEVSWSYSAYKYKAETIQALANNYLVKLVALIMHCSTKEKTSFTPSDFGLAHELDYKDLDNIQRELAEAEDGEDILKF